MVNYFVTSYRDLVSKNAKALVPGVAETLVPRAIVPEAAGALVPEAAEGVETRVLTFEAPVATRATDATLSTRATDATLATRATGARDVFGVFEESKALTSAAVVPGCPNYPIYIVAGNNLSSASYYRSINCPLEF
jgi:hypothetical protein